MTSLKWAFKETILVFFMLMIWLGPELWIKVGLTLALVTCEIHELIYHLNNGKKKYLIFKDNDQSMQMLLPESGSTFRIAFKDGKTIGVEVIDL